MNKLYAKIFTIQSTMAGKIIKDFFLVVARTTGSYSSFCLSKEEKTVTYMYTVGEMCWLVDSAHASFGGNTNFIKLPIGVYFVTMQSEFDGNIWSTAAQPDSTELMLIVRTESWFSPMTLILINNLQELGRSLVCFLQLLSKCSSYLITGWQV